MDEQNKKERDWSFLLPGGKPARRQRMELKKIRDTLEELEVDIEGVALDTELDFRDFVTRKETPGDDVMTFLKKILGDAGIDYAEPGFRRMVKKDCLELFFEVFTIGIGEGDTAAATEVETEKAVQTKEAVHKEIVSDDGDETSSEEEPLTMALMDALYKKWKKESVASISTKKCIITEQMPVRAQDDFTLRLDDDAPEISHTRAALFNIHFGKTVAVGHLEGDHHQPRLVFSSQDIDYKSIQKNELHEIILFSKDASAPVFYAVPCKVKFHQLEESERTLCIDFGTSNTTAGSYGILDKQANRTEIVLFPVDAATTRRMIPTLAYVDSCAEGQPVRYVFGYEAKKRIAADHFENKATVFHELKSWMNDLDHKEPIFDAQGNNAEVRREDVIKAYLSHVISLSEQYFHKRFKYIHFSAPVKLKESFLGKMRDMFPQPDYKVLSDTASIDEGIAIVYRHIADRIQEMKDGESETVFVIDCGGGTTDLARCEYSQREAEIGDGKKILSVKTSFENGDSAFGGNNITYRILQMLKIKIDAYLREQPNPDMLALLADNEIDIMTMLDEGERRNELFKVKEKLYQAFTHAYEAAEERIPTHYGDEDLFDKDIRFMRRNYNYLWQMAESIKIEFYKSSNTVSVDFSKEEDRNICIGGQEDYYLYVRSAKDAPWEKKMAPLGDIRITIKEISRIICPDIYTLLNILVGGDNSNQTLQEVNYYKFSGQSCNITLFHDLMKEFVPGRYIRRDSRSVNEEDRSEKLKIACIEGSIRYLMEKDFSRIQPKIEMAPPELLYQVYEVPPGGSEKLALGREKGVLNGVEKANLLPNFISVHQARFVVKDMYGQEKNNIFYEFERKKENRKEVSNLGELEKELLNDTYWDLEMLQKHITTPLDNITLNSKEEEQQCIFLLPAKNGYGFRIYQVRIGYGANGVTKYALVKNAKDGHNYGVYHSFEQMASFFDGQR